MHGARIAVRMIDRWRLFVSRMLHLPRRKRLLVIALAQDAPTVTTLLMAAFHESWAIRFALSSADAHTLLRRGASAFIYAGDPRGAAWRDLCNACVQSGVPFHLAAHSPSDELFLSVAAAGGSSVLWKPLIAEQVVAAVAAARIPAAPIANGADCRA